MMTDSYGVDKISKETNIPKNRILYVGDMEVDLKTAENSGINIVWGWWLDRWCRVVLAGGGIVRR